MRRIGTIFAVSILLALLVGNASAQFLGQMSPASVLNKGTGKAGGYLVLAEDAMAVVGSISYGMSEYVEGRARLGMIDPEGGDMGIILGGDFKYLLWKYKEMGNPFDMSIGGTFEYSDFEGGSLLGLGGSLIGSIPFTLENGRVIEPYARFNLRMQRVSADGGGSDSDFKAGVNIGALFMVMDLMDFTAELQIDDQVAFMFGVDLVAF